MRLVRRPSEQGAEQPAISVVSVFRFDAKGAARASSLGRIALASSAQANEGLTGRRIAPPLNRRVKRRRRTMIQRSVLEIREFRTEDGTACYELRRSAFLGVFTGVLSPKAAQMGADSYSAAEFSRRIGGMVTHVATLGSEIAAFCTIRKESQTHGELLYLYVGEKHRGTGIGSALVRYSEKRVLELNPNLGTLYLETAVPKYNQPFWERMGYRFVGSSVCEYPTGSIPAVRLEKSIKGHGN
jgi:GNAT superfamily N-acetyltransferase